MVPPPAAPVVVGGEAAAVAGAVGQGVRQVSGKDDDEEMGGSCEGTREQCAMRDGTRGPEHTELPIADKDPTGGKLENPAPTENTATTLTTPDQSDKNGASHTGKTDGAPSTAGNTTTTPIPDGPSQDDLAYLTEGHMLGANGVQTSSKTIWKGAGKERIDVENPAPGQLHYQDNKDNKYLYDPKTDSFPDAPKSVNSLLNDPSFRKEINKGMTQYLGEKK
ncbi:hypothetical protein GW590_06880 [Rahnella sp. SAP-1]|uniref:Filamentous hemagglutinin n=1 Tax=Rouxiella aceris TaxID=2703884 RepID=A0A848MHE6_9GAMM|nr:hypothetical protein [Rouxiella aceris]NMP26589.1 hypothetical protein [Rouxiella aceris]